MAGKGDEPRDRGLVLVAEDEADIRDVLAELLSAEGYSVVAVGTVDEAVRALTGPRPIGIALLDHWLPDGTGAEVCRLLKARTARAVPCLMFSASPANEREARAAGADGWMTKPFDLELLLAQVASLSEVPRRSAP